MAIQELIEEAAVHKKLAQRTVELVAVLQRCEQLQAELSKVQIENANLKSERDNLETALSASKEQVNSLLLERNRTDVAAIDAAKQ